MLKSFRDDISVKVAVFTLLCVGKDIDNCMQLMSNSVWIAVLKHIMSIKETYYC